MISIKTTETMRDIGKFKQETRDLDKQLEKYKETKAMLDKEKIYIDTDIHNFEYFMEKLKSITVNEKIIQ
jgi:hypothetical protein